MNRPGWFLFGATSLCAIAFAAGTAFVLRAHGFKASEEPSNVERWIARKARSAALPSDARALPNPVPDTLEVLAQARAHWADHCAVCHANDGSGDTQMGKRTYPPAPDMRLPATQEMTDGELFFIIQNGIRLSGMPAWGGGAGHDEEDSWKLVHFIRHLPQMTVEEKKEMEKMNPKSPDDLKEEQEEERFLKGEDTNAHPIEHHHH
ncbi:MAG TPA: c-type cytochrome [Bryobacteraceae bacterium]|nr:c-type cytochrome [Bryobacteraceae bacterium]